MVSSFVEKRVDPRAEIEEEARYKILSEEETGASYGYEKAVTKNISKGGVCMAIPRKLEVGHVIRVELPIPEEGKERNIKAFCEVQWCKKLHDSDTFEIGLSFIALKEEDAEFLGSYVDVNVKRAM